MTQIDTTVKIVWYYLLINHDCVLYIYIFFLLKICICFIDLFLLNFNVLQHITQYNHCH